MTITTLQACSQKLLLGVLLGKMCLFGKIVEKSVDLLFREGGSSAPREPPGYGPAIILLLATAGILAVSAECQKDNAPIKIAAASALTRGNQEYIS